MSRRNKMENIMTYKHCFFSLTLQWRYNDHDCVWSHQPHGCLLNRLFRRRSKKTSKLRVTGLCVGNSPGPVNSPHKRASYAENASIWWRHHANEVSWTTLSLEAKQMLLPKHVCISWCNEEYDIYSLSYIRCMKCHDITMWINTGRYQSVETLTHLQPL